MQVNIPVDANDSGHATASGLRDNLRSLAEGHLDIMSEYDLLIEIIPEGSTTRDVRISITGNPDGSACSMLESPDELPTPILSEEPLGVFDDCAAFFEPWIG